MSRQKKLITTEPLVKQPPKTKEELEGTLNPYMPLGIAKEPWYGFKQGTVSKEKNKSKSIPIGKSIQATQYRKGSCENCGAKTHSSKACLDRPRKKGAKWTGEKIMRDEVIKQPVAVDFDAKRDRWDGYNEEDQLELVREWELVEQKRLEIRQQKTMKKLERAANRALLRKQGQQIESSDSEEDEEKFADEAEQIGQKMDWILDARVTIRNLRIREDTAKYLRNLDLDSAEYDPKSRSMKENPYSNKNTIYAGDEFERFTGQVKELHQFAWEADQKGAKGFTTEANPTRAEKLFKEFKEKKESSKVKTKDSILDRYGNQEEHVNIPNELILGQTEEYIEYDPTGKQVMKQASKSIYEENVYLQNHTSVWGSWWNQFQWGYACCHEVVKQSYCGGEASIKAKQDAKIQMQQSLTVAKEPIQPQQNSSTTNSIKNVEKRNWNQEIEDQVNEYQLKRIRYDDPMANYVDKE